MSVIQLMCRYGGGGRLGAKKGANVPLGEPHNSRCWDGGGAIMLGHLSVCVGAKYRQVLFLLMLDLLIYTIYIRIRCIFVFKLG